MRNSEVSLGKTKMKVKETEQCDPSDQLTAIGADQW
jgi:hypothetical protein